MATEPSITVTSSTITGARRKKQNVWEVVVTATHDDDDLGAATQALNMNGLLQKIIFDIPNFNDAVDGQLVIKDNANNTIFDSGLLTKGNKYAFNVNEPLSGEIDVVIGISAAAGGAGGTEYNMVATLRGI